MVQKLANLSEFDSGDCKQIYFIQFQLIFPLDMDKMNDWIRHKMGAMKQFLTDIANFEGPTSFSALRQPASVLARDKELAYIHSHLLKYRDKLIKEQLPSEVKRKVVFFSFLIFAKIQTESNYEKANCNIREFGSH